MSNFQIGIYQPNVAPDPFGQIDTTTNPYLRDYGEDGYVLFYYDIYDPRSVTLEPPAAVGQDTGGFPSVRGFSKMTWTYPFARAENWYFLYYLHRLARQSAGQFTGHVRIHWPDPQTGATQDASARWDAIVSTGRDMPNFRDFSLVFSHLGIDDSMPIAGIWTA